VSGALGPVRASALSQVEREALAAGLQELLLAVADAPWRMARSAIEDCPDPLTTRS
jgi:hypothetical protein